MLRNIKILLGLIAWVLIMPACGMDSDLKPCYIWLDFIYDYNMEYVDSFDPQVKWVDVYVFDNDGKYLFTKHAESQSELTNGKRMSLSYDLPFGTYKIITVGGLSDKFSVTDGQGNGLVPGTTSLEDIQIALKQHVEEVSYEFPDLWLAEATTITHQGKDTEWPVMLMKETNKFTLSLAKMTAEEENMETGEYIPQDEKDTEDESNSEDNTDRQSETRAGQESKYTFEITTTENTIRACDNTPLSGSKITYKPYLLTPGEDETTLSTGELNTMRLINGEKPYQLIVRNKQTGKLLWQYNLIELLKQLKPTTRPDGTELPLQEFLDRQSNWKVVVLYKDEGEEGGEEPTPDGDYGWTVLGVKINNWIIRFYDIDINNEQ